MESLNDKIVGLRNRRTKEIKNHLLSGPTIVLDKPGLPGIRFLFPAAILTILTVTAVLTNDTLIRHCRGMTQKQGRESFYLLAKHSSSPNNAGFFFGGLPGQKDKIPHNRRICTIKFSYIHGCCCDIMAFTHEHVKHSKKTVSIKRAFREGSEGREGREVREGGDSFLRRPPTQRC